MKKAVLLLLLILPGLYTYLSAYPQPENTVRVMSYNVRNGKGMDDITDYTRIADIILRVSPDVVALQELDSVTVRSGQIDVLACLGNLTGMYAVYGASVDFQGGKYGVGVLSKEKPLSWKRIPLPGREERRSLLIVELDKYIVCCTHYSLNEEDRLASSELINRETATFGKPAFLMGDFNDTPQSAAILKLAEHWTMLNDPQQPTFPSDKPSERIDHIFGHADGHTYSVHSRRVLDEPVASDHSPLFVDVRVNVEHKDTNTKGECLLELK